MPKKIQSTLLSMFNGYIDYSLPMLLPNIKKTQNSYRGSAHTYADSKSSKRKKRRKVVDEAITKDRFKRKKRDTLLKRLRENSDSLSKDQKRVLTIVGSGHNTFFTGSAGTGKSATRRPQATQTADSKSTSKAGSTPVADLIASDIDAGGGAGAGAGTATPTTTGSPED